MKVIPKSKFDKVIELTRFFYETTNPSLLSERIELACDIGIDTGVSWLSIIDVVDMTIRSHGFKPDAAKEDIYLVLRVLGWEVADEEVQASESL